MRQRGDMTCYHEPYGEPWYQGEEPLWPRYQEGEVRTPGLTMDSVHKVLQAQTQKGPAFSKDFPMYLDHMWNDDLFDMFNHSFLIRDPAKTITSMYAKWPDFHEKEVGYVELKQLFDIVADRTGSPPPLIDSDDMLENPHDIIEKWANAVGIPHMPESLSWEPGARDEVSWWDGGSFHTNLRNSDGLKPQERKYVDINDAPDRVKEIYDKVMPIYEYLHSHRL